MRATVGYLSETFQGLEEGESAPPLTMSPLAFHLCVAWSGPPKSQVGAIHREIWLTVLELHSFAIGKDEVSIRAAREADEQVLCEEDVGLFVKARIVWAKKGGP